MKSSSAYFLLIGAAFLWSLGGLFIKMVDLHPVAITGIRSLGAATVFLFYIKRPKWYWRPYFIGGILAYSGMVILYVVSIRLTTAANAIFWRESPSSPHRHQGERSGVQVADRQPID